MEERWSCGLEWGIIKYAFIVIYLNESINILSQQVRKINIYSNRKLHKQVECYLFGVFHFSSYVTYLSVAQIQITKTKLSNRYNSSSKTWYFLINQDIFQLLFKCGYFFWFQLNKDVYGQNN